MTDPTDHKPTEISPVRNHRKIGIIILTIVILIVAVIAFIYWIIWGRFKVDTDDAYVNGNVVQLMAQVPGKVIAINTDDTYLVQKGQLLIKLDPTNMVINLQNAEANLALAVRTVRQLFENASRAQATLLLRKSDLLQAQADFKRRLGLIGERAISREELQHYQLHVATAEAQYDYALHNLRYAQSLVENTYLYTHPFVERAKVIVKNAYLDVIRTNIVSPVTGYVAKRSIQIGQQVTMSTLLLAIVPLNAIWVDANYKSHNLVICVLVSLFYYMRTHAKILLIMEKLLG